MLFTNRERHTNPELSVSTTLRLHPNDGLGCADQEGQMWHCFCCKDVKINRDICKESVVQGVVMHWAQNGLAENWVLQQRWGYRPYCLDHVQQYKDHPLVFIAEMKGPLFSDKYPLYYCSGQSWRQSLFKASLKFRLTQIQVAQGIELNPKGYGA